MGEEEERDKDAGYVCIYRQAKQSKNFRNQLPHVPREANANGRDNLRPKENLLSVDIFSAKGDEQTTEVWFGRAWKWHFQGILEERALG